MKTRIAIVVAVLAAALFAVGCDQILETIYPEFKQGSGEKGGITVEISFDNTISSYNNMGSSFAGNNIPIVVALIPFSQGYDPGTDNYVYRPIDGQVEKRSAFNRDFTFDSQQGRTLKRFSFPVEMNGTYKVIAWLDVNNDHRTDEANPEPGSIVYTQGGDFFLDLTYHKSNDPTIYMGTILSVNNTINWMQYNADPNNQGGETNAHMPQMPSINVPSTEVPSGVEIVLRSTNEYDEGGWIVDREWTIVRPGFPPEMHNGMQELYKVFNNQGASAISVDVKLRVRDNQDGWSPYAVITLRIQPQGATNQPPYAQINQGSSMNVGSGQSIYLNSSSYDNGGWPSQYEWVVRNDMNVEVGRFNSEEVYFSLQNTLAMAVNYTVTLRVADNQGMWNDDLSNPHPNAVMSIEVGAANVVVNNPPVASFSAWPGLTVDEGTAMSFSSESYDNETWISGLSWYVNDGYGEDWQSDYEDLGTFYWTPPSAGPYTIRLEVTEGSDGGDYNLTRTVSYSQTVNVISTSGLGSQVNPFTMSGYGTSSGDVLQGESQFYLITGLSNSANQRIVLAPSVGDCDLKVYSDSSLGYMIGAASAGGTNTDTVLVNGYESVFVKVIGYYGGPYDLSAVMD